MDTRILDGIAKVLVGPGKGLLAADESTSTIEKRFAALSIPSNEETRRQWRQLLFAALPKLGLGGVILHAETLTQQSDSGQPLIELLTESGIIPGVKVDLGTEALAPDSPELVTKGLYDLPDRLTTYLEQAPGLKFAKWRAVIKIDPAKRLPSNHCLAVNSGIFVQYANVCQKRRLLPIVEPEVTMDGGHTIEQCAEATARTLRSLFYFLREAQVYLPSLLLKVNMVLPGKECPEQVNDEVITQKTVEVMMESVPQEVPGIVFLSGGQTPQEATKRLNLISLRGREVKVPWQLSFSFARALQEEAMAKWLGQPTNVEVAQQVFKRRVSFVAAARQGQYGPVSHLDN